MFNKINYEKIVDFLDGKAKLICVSKGKTADEINDAIMAGARIFGESYVREAEDKIRKVRFSSFNSKIDVKFHLIGHLQSNKAKKAVELFDCIQTLDNVKIVDIINEECEKIKKIMPVMIEINFGENSKSGVNIENIEFLDEIINHVRNKKYLELIGLMCIPPVGKEDESFDSMNKLRWKYHLKELSMGMTDDYKTAIKYGSTFVRIGRAIFGQKTMQIK